MSPEGDTQHCQAVGRGGRRTGKGTLEKYLLLKKFQLIMTAVEMAKKECHYGITTFLNDSRIIGNCLVVNVHSIFSWG